MHITSVDNSLIKMVSQLNKHSGRKKYSCFALEGDKLIKEAIQWGYKPIDIFVEENSRQKYSDFIDMGAHTVTLAVLKKITNSITPQGVVATFRLKELEIPQINRAIILENIQDPGNVGTIFRTAESFGVDCIIFVGDCVDITSPKVVRSSMGSVLRLACISFETPQQLKSFVEQKQISVYSAVLNEKALPITKVKLSMPCAFAIGNEGSGLSNDFLNCFDNGIYIPMTGKTESLNAAVAASVVMWEMYK